MAAIALAKLNQLIIPELLWLQICSHADEKLPEEACGLLAGKDQRVQEVIPIPNILHSPVRYRMDPTDQLRAFQRIEDGGLDLAGIFHSHPLGPDCPSDTDIAEAYYPESVYVILFPYVTTGWKARGFIINALAVNEIPLIITMGI
jgi:proteasome lid subunit RPN8/RPN11